MQVDNKTICNVCSKESTSSEKIVFVQAVCGEDAIHICTACIPHVIHGGSEIVKPNPELS